MDLSQNRHAPALATPTAEPQARPPMPDASPARYRTAWISDLHLGTRGCNAEAVLRFLREVDAETLYLVGDLIDVWSLRRSRYWPQAHNDVIQKILRKGRKGTPIIYIPGNHDEMMRGFLGEYGNLRIVRRAIHTTADGRRLLIIHGDELDTVIQNVKWLAYVGDVGYQFLLRLNRPVNFLRRRFGLGYWSLSAYVKHRVKNAVAFIGEFEKAVVRLAGGDHVDGVLCGHIHSAAVHETPGTVSYYNCGDFVESCTALVEHADGRMELLQGFQYPTEDENAPAVEDEEGPMLPSDEPAFVFSPKKGTASPGKAVPERIVRRPADRCRSFDLGA